MFVAGCLAGLATWKKMSSKTDGVSAAHFLEAVGGKKKTLGFVQADLSFQAV